MIPPSRRPGSRRLAAALTRWLLASSAALLALASCGPPAQQPTTPYCVAPPGSAPAYGQPTPSAAATAPGPVPALTVAGVVTPSPANAAGVVSFCQTAPEICLRALRAQEAADLLRDAADKANARNGQGCLADLDRYDQIETRRPSTDPRSGAGYTRARCLMLSGQCDAGKQLFQKTQEAQVGGQMSPEMIDRGVEAQAGLYCQGGSMKPRDQLIKAMTDLQQGAFMTKKDVATCQSALATVKQLRGTVKPDEENPLLKDIDRTLPNLGANCLAKAGDCSASFKFFFEEASTGPGMARVDPRMRSGVVKNMFKALVQVPGCKDLAKMAAGEGPCQADADCASGKCIQGSGMPACQ